MKYFIITIFIFLCLCTKSQNVIITSKAPSYIDKNITIYKHKDFISEEKDILAHIKVNKDGHFSFKYNTNTTELLYIDAGYFLLSLFVYPNQKVDISLPVYQDVPEKDIYFKPVELFTLVNTENKQELNYLIRNFNQDIAILNDKYFDAIRNRDISAIKKVKKSLDEKYISNNEYFNTYKRFSIGMCEFPMYMENLKPFIAKYFSDKAFDNYSYFELFQKTFTNIYSYDEYVKIPKLNAEKLYNIQAKSLIKQGVISKDVIDLVILLSLKDGSFRPVLNEDLYINTIKYIRDKSISKQTKYIAENVLNKVTYLRKSYTFPNINGKNINGHIINTSDKKGEYLYIMFLEKSNALIEEDLKIVAAVADRKPYLKVLIVCDENNKDSNIKDLKKFNLHDNALFCSNYKLLKSKFRVITTPSYFLIDKKGKIIQAHTIRPQTNLYKNLNSIDINELKENGNNKSKYFN